MVPVDQSSSFQSTVIIHQRICSWTLILVPSESLERHHSSHRVSSWWMLPVFIQDVPDCSSSLNNAHWLSLIVFRGLNILRHRRPPREWAVPINKARRDKTLNKPHDFVGIASLSISNSIKQKSVLHGFYWVAKLNVNLNMLQQARVTGGSNSWINFSLNSKIILLTILESIFRF